MFYLYREIGRRGGGGGEEEAEVVNGVACCFMSHKIVSQFKILGSEKAPSSKRTYVVLSGAFISQYTVRGAGYQCYQFRISTCTVFISESVVSPLITPVTGARRRQQSLPAECGQLHCPALVRIQVGEKVIFIGLQIKTV